MTNPTNERGWDAGWDEHTRAQRRRLAALSLIEKLEWLENAQRLAEHMLRRPVPRSDQASR